MPHSNSKDNSPHVACKNHSTCRMTCISPCNTNFTLSDRPPDDIVKARPVVGNQDKLVKEAITYCAKKNKNIIQSLAKV
jgi:hypothetical protein